MTPVAITSLEHDLLTSPDEKCYGDLSSGRGADDEHLSVESFCENGHDVLLSGRWYCANDSSQGGQRVQLVSTGPLFQLRTDYPIEDRGSNGKNDRGSHESKLCSSCHSGGCNECQKESPKCDLTYLDRASQRRVE
jgi:hypothetical protein